VGSRLTGIIDWGDAMIKDPAWDLARASLMASAQFSALLDAYGLKITDELRRRWAPIGHCVVPGRWRGSTGPAGTGSPRSKIRSPAVSPSSTEAGEGPARDDAEPRARP
jgi:hypothetical protein